MNSSIRLKRFDLGRTDYEDALITAYQRVFAGPPWFETWETEQVRSDIRTELSKDSSCWIALDRTQPLADAVIGFAWGYLHRPKLAS